MLGHLLRTNNYDDPLRQVTFEGDTWYPRLIPKRRVGKPRDRWIVETIDEAWDETLRNDQLIYDYDDEEHRDIY